MKGRSAKRVVGFLFFGTLVLFGLSALVMVLWNFAVVPSIGWQPLNYWQAMALLALSKILFTGFGPRGAGHGRHKRWEKWRNMSPEDREAFRERWKRHQQRENN